MVELFATSSEGLRAFEKSAGDQHSAALAAAAALQAQLAAATAACSEQEQAAALEWRRMRKEVSWRWSGMLGGPCLRALKLLSLCMGMCKRKFGYVQSSPAPPPPDHAPE